MDCEALARQGALGGAGRRALIFPGGARGAGPRGAGRWSAPLSAPSNPDQSQLIPLFTF